MGGPAQIAQGVCPQVRFGHCVGWKGIGSEGFSLAGFEVWEVELNQRKS